MEEINKAFIQRLAWLVLSKPDLLWVRILKAKYFPTTTVLGAGPRPRASLIWQGIAKVLNSLRDNICFIPGNGSAISIREDLWIPWLSNHRPVWIDSVVQGDNVQFVSDLAVDGGGWNFPLLSSLFTTKSVHQILRLMPPNVGHHDSVIWTLMDKGGFSVKEAIIQYQSQRRPLSLHLSSQDWSKL